MRTYSHALLTWAVARRVLSTEPAPAAELDAEVCARNLFRRPDAALHSALSVAVALALYGVSGARRRSTTGALPTLLLGWAGHVATDALTHGSDARPFLWPLSSRRFESPVSYRESERCALPLTVAEHVALLVALVPARDNSS